MKQLINITLTLVFTGIMIVPFVGSHFILDENSTLGSVAGARSVSFSDVQILPNYQNFDSYVTFNPQGFEDGVYADSLSLSIFQHQKASYSGVYTVYNTSSDKTLVVRAHLSEVITPNSSNFSLLAISLRKGAGYTFLSDAMQGDTVITIDPVHSVVKDSEILIGLDTVRVIAVSTEGRIVVTPLDKDYPKGTEVVPSPLLMTDKKVLRPETGEVTLLSGESLTVDGFVWGAEGLEKINQSIEIPLSIVIRESE